ncbi:amidase [Streptomyces caatingaensis]|uniref:6-aminohexanoate hydrolase n=1 Tax=Streptomyces caatingaensis TaxID=1678637 RepID=A0A0K9XKY2_9ACTN|nr:amidase [Streptomyces caatingaensis]KNB53963.1 6-aminohexanoate hydrolase [Streptomyces caatingaensis]
MKRSEYVSFDAVGLAGMVARGEVEPGELEAAALAAVEAVNPRLNAVIETWPGEDVPVPGSTPLAGVPFLIKDLGVTMAGKRAEFGSRLAAGATAPADSFLMRRLRRAGLVTFGRTSSPEMGFSLTTEPVLHGPTRNPWDTSLSPGGSSGGSAAAVAAGIVPVAHATDAGGSIRVPAAYNGLFGLKSTRARVSPGPEADEAYSGLAVHGCVSRTVRDSAALLDRIQGPEPGDAYVAPRPVRPYLDEVSRHPGTLRVGVLTRPWGGRAATAPVAAAVARTVALLAELGHRVEEATAELGASWEEFVVGNARLWCAHLAPWADGIAAALGRTVDASTLEPVLLNCYGYGRRTTAAELVEAFAMRNRVSRSLGRHLTDYDVLLTPTVPELPLPLGAYAEGAGELDAPGWLGRLFDRAPFAAVFNIAGTPAMSVPLESDAATGLPIGLQFAAGYGRDDVLFRLAGQLERARPWSGRLPEVWAGNDAA